MENKTDRELLELAAKACGYDTGCNWSGELVVMTRLESGVCIEGSQTVWNPLADNGQAFELSVKLQLRIDHVYREQQRVMVGRGECWMITPYSGDSLAATRRAIVIVAAMIGGGKDGH